MNRPNWTAPRRVPCRAALGQGGCGACARLAFGTDWSPDHNTLHDFMELMGEEGVRFINEYAVKWAVAEKLADPKVLVADTTAQEAAIPHPNELGLMAGFLTTVAAARERRSACTSVGAARREELSAGSVSG